MPLTLIRIPLDLERPWPVEERLAHNMVTSLRGALYDEIFARHCATAGACEPHGGRCRVLECLAGRLIKPATSLGKLRDHPPCLGLDIEAAEEDERRRTVLLVLWGRKASALATQAEAAFVRAAETRVALQGKAFRFAARGGERRLVSLADWVNLAPPPMGAVFTWHRVVAPKNTGPEDLRYLAANAAHDLVQWDLADSGAATALGAGAVDDAAEASRKAVVGAFAGLKWRVIAIRRFHDKRRSASGGHSYPIDAAEVEMELGGEIEPAWPWLRAMSLRGPGSRLALGIGQLSIFIRRS